jgi:hypothetical protein
METEKIAAVTFPGATVQQPTAPKVTFEGVYGFQRKDRSPECSGHIGVKLQCDLENKTVLVNYVDALLHANI